MSIFYAVRKTVESIISNNDGREFPVPHSGTRIHGTGQLSSASLFFLFEKMIHRLKRFSHHIVLSTLCIIITTTSLSCVSDAITAIPTPVLISPEDGSTVSQDPPLFIWHSVDGIAGYNLQVTDDTFGNLDAIIIDISCHPDTNFLPSMVFGSGSYNWRVQAVEGG